MRIDMLTEATYHVSEVNKSDHDTIDTLADLINDGGQLSWTLTTDRLLGKLGSKGMLFGLYDEYGDAVGVIGIKEINVLGVKGGEIGYLYIDPNHRSLANATKLYNLALNHAKDYPFLIATTITTNRAVNTLLAKSSKIVKAFTAQSPYSSNHLNYWLATTNNGQYTTDEMEELLKDKFGDNIIEESHQKNINESITFIDVDKAPSSFSPLIRKIAEKSSMISLEDGNEDDVKILFGRREGLPTEPNTIYVGNKFVPKDVQYDMLKGVVPTINTFTDSDDVEGDFIAKKKIGQRQAGQLVNIDPEDTDDYIFQPLLEIIAEYRVVVYFMNGEYHVSGMYKKVGSNVSLQSITSGEVYDIATQTAIKACDALGYGLSGVDLALVERTDNVSESIAGSAVSQFGKIAGKFSKQRLSDNEIIVVLEANTLPSMSNPMIFHDTITSALKNKR